MILLKDRMAKVTRGLLSVFSFFFWVISVLSVAQMAQAHGENGQRLAKLETKFEMHSTEQVKAMDSFYNLSWATVEKRIDGLEKRIDSLMQALKDTSDTVIDIRITLARGLGAVIAMQILISMRPWTLIKGNP